MQFLLPEMKMMKSFGVSKDYCENIIARTSFEVKKTIYFNKEEINCDMCKIEKTAFSVSTNQL